MSEVISPQELAEALNDKVTYYCAKISGDSYIDCLFNHNPEDLDIFIDSYIDEIPENADDKYWEAVKKEYEKLWMEDIATYTAERLADDIDSIRISIVENDNLNNYEKAYLLKKFKDALEELFNAINNAVNTQIPLSSDKLKEYLLKLYKTAGIPYRYPDDPIDYYTDYYNCLNKAGKLELLEWLSECICSTLDKVENDLKELNALEQ